MDLVGFDILECGDAATDGNVAVVGFDREAGDLFADLEGNVADATADDPLAADLDVPALDGRVELAALLDEVLYTPADRAYFRGYVRSVPSSPSTRSAVVQRTVPKNPEMRKPSAERLKITPYRS